MKIQFRLLFLILLLTCCNQPKQSKSTSPKGELAFLLQYNNRLPSDVGFLTNHIMERRVANLLKENFQPFMHGLGNEHPLIIDTNRQIIRAPFGNFEICQSVIVDVANDAIWITYNDLIKDSSFVWADHPSLEKPL